MDADFLIDRNRLKRRVTFWRVTTIVIAVALIATAVGRFTGATSQSYIARLNVDQIIVNDQDRLNALADIIEDSNIKALLVTINSPGGTVVGGEALHHALVGTGKNIPVVAVMGDVATSAGYMIAVAADHIIAREGTITGSIGVLFQTAEITDLLSKLGISVEAIKSGPLKAEPSPFKKLTPAIRHATQILVDDMFDMFVGMVASKRRMTPLQVRSLADGRVFTGRMALKEGLIDAIGGEREALQWLTENKGLDKNLPVRKLTVRRKVRDWFEHLSSLARKTVLSERLTLDGLVSVWHPQLR
ncbi:signal peptide peptidase SppA [Alphaproteobacteria bacterium]|nr:signal peptide peptidase SppA [Alphaproteobacteria bacterium]